MVTRDLSVVLNLQGAIDRSLPNSVSALQRRLEGLKASQAANRTELRQVQVALKNTSRSAAEYQAIVNRRDELRAKLKADGDELRNVNGRLGNLSERLSAARTRLRGATLAVAGTTAAFLAMGYAVQRAGQRFAELNQQAGLLGTSTEQLIRSSERLGVLLGNVGQGQQAANAVADYSQQLRLARQGVVQLDNALAGRAGINLFELSTDPEQLQRQLADIFRNASPPQVDALSQLLPRDVFIAAQQESRLTREQLEQLAQARDNVQLTPEQQASLVEFNRSLTQLQISLGAVTDIMRANLAPALTFLADTINPVVASIRDFAQENPRVAQTLGALAVALGAAAVAASGLFTVLALAAVAKASLVTLGITGGISLGVLTGGFVSASVAAAGFLISLGPFLPLAIAIGAAAFLIYRNWDRIVGFFRSAFETIKGNAENLLLALGPAGFLIRGAIAIVRNWDRIVSVVQGALRVIGAAARAIGGFVLGLWNRIAGFVIDRVNFIIRIIQRVIELYNRLPLLPDVEAPSLIGQPRRDVAALPQAGQAAGNSTVNNRTENHITNNITIQGESNPEETVNELERRQAARRGREPSSRNETRRIGR